MTYSVATTAAPVADFHQERARIHRTMLSAVSHDLKTPLSSIIGSLEIYERMKEKLTPEKQQMLISTALQEAYRLDNFISNILDMAKLEGGIVKMHAEQCDVGSVLDDCLIKLGQHYGGVEMKIHAVNGSLRITTDPVLLCRAVTLVFDNAIKHGGNPPHVQVEYGRANGEVFIRVRDNGPGIPLGGEQDIFNKYKRIDRRDSQNAGTGLGLSICREVMRLLGGTVQGANSSSGGAEFTLTLPNR